MNDAQHLDHGSAWPSERGRYSGIVVQFGTTRANLLRDALTTGDRLADAVVEAIHADRARSGANDVRSQLALGIRHGLAAVDQPHPSVAALLTSTEQLPDYATDDLLDNGPLPFFSMPAAVHMVSLSAGALIRVYESPSIATVLATTGRLIEGADRRIRETGKWVSTVMLPGRLRPGQDGYIGTLQVRMLHAHMRRVARNRGFDESAYGVPINQVDLARTWMDFTLTMLEAESRMGLGLTSAETASIYRYWWVVGHLLGIQPQLVEGIQTNDQARRVDDLLQAATGPLLPESSQLANATLESIAELLHEAMHVPESLGVVGLHSLARRFHPEHVADELGLRKSAVANKALDAAISRLRSRRADLRNDPAKWAEEQRKQIEGTVEFLAEVPSPLYETHEAPKSS